MTETPASLPKEFVVLKALFAGDADTVIAQFDGEPNVDVSREGTARGEDAVRALVAKWSELYPSSTPIEIHFRLAHRGDGGLHATEAYFTGTGPFGPTVTPIAAVGQFDGERLTQVRVYGFERSLTGEGGVRQTAFPERTDLRPVTPDDLTGVDAEYFVQNQAWNLEGLMATFSDDAWIELGDSVVERPNIDDMYRAFFGEEQILICSNQAYDGDFFLFEWLAGHGEEPRQSGFAVYEHNEAGDRIRSIRMYDFYDPRLQPSIAVRPNRLPA